MARETALGVLGRIEDDAAYSHLALDAALNASDLDDRDAGLATELVYGTLTWRRALDAILSKHVRGGLARLDPVALNALRLGVYQLVFLDRIPDHAATGEMVELVKRQVNKGAAGLVNAVLRKVAATKSPRWWSEADRERKPVRYLGDRYSLPNWIANRLIQQFGMARAEAIAASFSQRPPLWARDVATSEPIRLEGMDDAARAAILGGSLVIQDLGSQLVARLAEGSGRALDACAGVGGKSLAIARFYDEVVALDPQQTKLEMLQATAERVGISNVTVRAGTLQNADFDEPFDTVLVDAPCTGLGVVRRHPETRWTKREADVTTLSRLQMELLDAAAPLVKPGGLLVYSVCTFTREETSKQAERFLERHPEFTVEPLPAELADYADDAGYLRPMPDEHDADAFFGVRMRRAG